MLSTTPLLVLGLGNVLCRDDGVGIAALVKLASGWQPPPRVRLLDGGTLGLGLLPWLERARAVLLLDAVKTDDPPGTIVRLEGEEVSRAAAHRLSPHQVGVADVLDGARLRGKMPARLVLVGVVPETIELGLGLSSSVRAALPAMVERAVAEAAALGRPFTRRPRARIPPTLLGDSHAHRLLGL